ncbi:MAG: hypothetical protein H6550_13955 [Chitinophagales bacterium]|nr:hypothetical protein [Chitinophagales bacterium]
MKKLILILYIPVLIFTASCDNNGISRNGDGEKVYTYSPIGWQMAIPENWEILSETQRDKLAYAAQNYYEEESLSNNKEGEKKIILGVRKSKDDINSVYAFVRSYNREEDHPSLHDLLTQQYRSYSADFYSADTSLTKEIIDGISFEIAVLSVQYRDKPYFTYTTYSTMLDTLNFGVSIVSNNANDEDMLINNFKSSISSLKK